MKYLHKIIPIFVLAAILSSGVAAAEDLIHVVGRGETIFSISRFYRVTAEELMRVNGITDPSRLQAGRRLTIPSSAFPDAAVSSTAAPAAATNAPSIQLTSHRVVRGDTLFSIARTNGITLQQLLEINRFSPDHVIRAGDTIQIPLNNATAQSGTSGTSPANVSAGRPGGAAQTGLLSLRWPINAREVTYMTGQMGVIIEGEHLEPVRSLTEGRVISAGPWRRYGRVVIVEAPGGYFYMYGGCESLSVSVGDRVSVGTEIGRLGVNAVSERAQLFFMVFRNDTPIDPAKAPRAGNNGRT